MFGPLIIVFVAVLSSIFLHETLHLGECEAPALSRFNFTTSLTMPSRFCLTRTYGWTDELYYTHTGIIGSALGAVLIVGGLYMVLWGKAREAQEKEAGGAAKDEEQLGCESMPHQVTGGDTK
jgi:hypothetical protein